MSSGFDLLGVVLPPEGRYCVLGIESYRRQTFWDTREQVETEVEYLSNHGFDVYYGCAKYGSENSRKQRNALHFRALWMDLDCGPTKGAPDVSGAVKGYFTKEEALLALRGFCVTLGLPKPVLVDSGGGIHVYWVLTETIDRSHWEALAMALRTLTSKHGLHVDGVVFEAARVLRVPGTANLKEKDNPRPVVVISEAVHALPYSEWKRLLAAGEPVQEPDYLPRRLSPLMDSLSGDRTKSFRKIMLRSSNGEGCAQLLYAYENQATVEYPLWRAALSIPAFCEDRDFGIHIMSKYHPDYSPAETERKAGDIGGPYTCAKFEEINPAGCANCTLKGKFKSPITLGAEIVRQQEPECEPTPPESAEDAPPAETAGFTIAAPGPTVPAPYIVGQSGAIYETFPGEEVEPALVYEHPLHVVKRMLDPELGEVALINLKLPQDGAREFVLPLAVLAAKEKARDALSQRGVIVGEKGLLLVQRYLMSCLKNLQLIRKAEVMHQQFGWANDQGNRVFIVGERAYSATSAYYSPPSSATASLCPEFIPQGTLEKWREVFDLYAKPGLEPQAFAALTAFGSPLLQHVGLNGAIINLIHSRSGSGKSTALYMCNSVWGHPKNIGAIWKDTNNHKMHRLGVLNNLPFTVDEITNMPAIEFSNLAYSISQGRGANRMKASVNEERKNNTSWQCISLCSSNASFYDKLSALKASPDGEMMRLLEYHVPPTRIIDPATAKRMFDQQLLDNYGHAGPIYIRYIMNAEAEVLALLRQVQATIDKRLKITPRERFWSAVAACNITGGLIAGKGCNLHSIDMKQMLDWVYDTIEYNRRATESPVLNGINVLGEFTNEHIGATLVLNGRGPILAPHLQSVPELAPRSSLVVRYEPDAHRMYVRSSTFREFCADRQVSMRDTLDQLQQRGIYLGAQTVRLSKGLQTAAAPTYCLVFNTQAGYPDSLDGTLYSVVQATQEVVAAAAASSAAVTGAPAATPGAPTP